MDADENTTLLKKMQKDMVSIICKASDLEQELKASKEEGERLKQMMDSQAKVAEATALFQQKKIHELEAKLHRTEYMVRNLSDELKETQVELKSLKGNIPRPSHNDKMGEGTIKHTHEKKRKRLASEESNMNPPSGMEKKMVHNPNGDKKPEPSLSTLLTESKERKLMEMAARQLIAMSQGKRLP